MAKFVGKTFGSLNLMLNNSGLFLNAHDKTSNKLLPWTIDSKYFVRKLKYAETKQAEEDFITAYITAMEERLSAPDVPNAEIDEMIKLCMTCEIMGYPTPFIYVHSLKLAQKGNLQQKQTGYSSAAFFLHPNHELVILLINTIQKDLRSSNHMEVLLALSSICNLINMETVQNVLHLVEEKLLHEKPSVRKSAVLTLGHCLLLTDSQSAYQISIPKLEKALTDMELEVVAAAVSIIHKIAQKILHDFSYLIKCLVELQDQILLRRVPHHMVYCDIPAPWLQLDILKLLNHICKETENYEQVTPVLKKTLQQVGLQNTLSHAIVFQVIEVITHVKPSNELAELALSSVSMFLKSKNINLKLIGVETLVLITKRLKPSITVAQQEVIMECLKLPDATLQLKTLELLFYLANPSNVQAISKKLMDSLIASTNSDRKKELALKLLELAVKFTDRQEWFISTCTSVLLEVENVPDSSIYKIIDTVTKDNTLKEIAREKCINACREGLHFTPGLMKLTASILTTANQFEEVLPVLFSNADEDASNWLLFSLMEVVLKSDQISSTLVTFLKNVKLKYEYSSQILSQLLQIIDSKPNIIAYNPDEEVDPTLSFLDGFVVEASEKDCSCYLPMSFRFVDTAVNEIAEKFPTDNLTSSETPFSQDSVQSSGGKSLAYSEISSPSTSFQSLSVNEIKLPTVSKCKTVWTEEGRKDVAKQEETLSEHDEITVKSKQDADDELKVLFAGLS